MGPWAAAALACLLSLSAQAADKIRIGTEGAYPPFNMVDSAGRVTGFDVDIASALCAAMQAECEIVTQDWDGIIPALLARKFDAIAASMSVTPERARAVDFTDPYYTNKLQFVAARGAAFDAAAPAGRTIGAQRATVAGQWLEANAKGASVKLYDTQENAWLDLASGRLDAVLADRLVSWSWLSGEAGKDFEFRGPPVLEDDRVAIAVRKGDDALRQRLNQALKAILADGTYQTINAKYFPFSIY